MVMDNLLKRRKIHCALDVGCGSAILTIALAKATRRRHYGIEIDAMSVKVAQENARLNGVEETCVVRLGDGCRAPDMPGRYDLIVANILARPLMEMAAEFRKHLLPGGEIILSGLLNQQEEMVLWAFRQQGLYLKERCRQEGWSALLLG
jgi:ribosomal protein L11 methyltransferase